VSSALVEIVWDPPWTPERISAQGKELLGMG
jgi:metal-sulfur cluster biosynthetic enzyme